MNHAAYWVWAHPQLQRQVAMGLAWRRIHGTGLSHLPYKPESIVFNVPLHICQRTDSDIPEKSC